MPYFFCEGILSVNKVINLAGEEARHIFLSRRTKPGQKINLQDQKSQRFSAEVLTVDKKGVKVKILKVLKVPPEPAVFLVLFLSIISEQPLDFVLQKGTELGLGKLVLFNSLNTATKLTPAAYQKKKPRWGKIVREAAKQSDRAAWPQIEFLPGVPEAKQDLANYDKIILFDIGGKNFNTTNKLKGVKSLALVVGPEGGFSNQEVGIFKALPKAETLSLGPVLLRADTACLAGLSAARLLTN